MRYTPASMRLFFDYDYEWTTIAPAATRQVNIIFSSHDLQYIRNYSRHNMNCILYTHIYIDRDIETHITPYKLCKLELVQLFTLRCYNITINWLRNAQHRTTTFHKSHSAIYLNRHGFNRHIYVVFNYILSMYIQGFITM